MLQLTGHPCAKYDNGDIVFCNLLTQKLISKVLCGLVHYKTKASLALIPLRHIQYVYVPIMIRIIMASKPLFTLIATVSVLVVLVPTVNLRLPVICLLSKEEKNIFNWDFIRHRLA